MNQHTLDGAPTGLRTFEKRKEDRIYEWRALC